MTNLVAQYEQRQIAKAMQDKNFPHFSPGDVVSVSVSITEGATQRVQDYTGVVIAKRNRGLMSSFVVRKISHDCAVERRFMIYSPLVSEIKLLKRGVVRRAKLFYLRGLSGKNARIKEKLTRSL